MNPDSAARVAKFDQAGAAMRGCAEVLVSMARPLIAAGVDPDQAAWIALGLMQTVLGVNELLEDQP